MKREVIRMPPIRTMSYEKNGRVIYFEVGFHTLEKGCAFVRNPCTGSLEQIYSVETRYIENQPHTRVETYPGKWYDLDGVTQLARPVTKCHALTAHAGTNRLEPDGQHTNNQLAFSAAGGKRFP